uniref:trypsin n=1 Tax=Phlebotomus papatasi TaxID=29031 RepID=A0A1B0D3I6_PHLPP
MKLFLAITLQFLSVLASPTSSVDKNGDGKIVGGYPANIEDFPYQGALMYRNRFLCGCSIISDQWILTAAHCTKGGKDKYFSVRVGSNYHARGGEVIQAKEVFNHPDYNSSTVNMDFALIHLQRPIEFNDKKQPVHLSELWEPIALHSRCKVSGWGETRDSTESNESLRAVVVNILDPEICHQAYSKFGDIYNENMLCAGHIDGGKDACFGDSGGPLVCEGRHVGVVSWGADCALPGHPGVYAKSAVVREWIRKHAGI